MRYNSRKAINPSQNDVTYPFFILYKSLRPPSRFQQFAGDLSKRDHSSVHRILVSHAKFPWSESPRYTDEMFPS